MLVPNIYFFSKYAHVGCFRTKNKLNGTSSIVKINPTKYLVNPTLLGHTPSHVQTNHKCGVLGADIIYFFLMYYTCFTKSAFLYFFDTFLEQNTFQILFSSENHILYSIICFICFIFILLIF